MNESKHSGTQTAVTGVRQLYSADQIAQRVEKLAAQISADYRDCSDPVLLIGVLRGAFIFLADLSRKLGVDRHIDFISLSSYEDGDQYSGAVRLIMDVRTPVEGRHVLIVDDIADTGRTLDYLQKNLVSRGAASVKTCVLLRKSGNTDVDYSGFDIPDEWVVGYGLDYADRFRTLPFIGVIDRDIATES